MPRPDFQVDYSGLVVAFETRGKLRYFFDRETGDVNGFYPAGRPEDVANVEACAASPERFVVVPPETPEINLGDRRAFLRTLDKPNLREALEATIAGPEPLIAFRQVLMDSPSEERRWFRFKEQRVHDRVGRWLAQNGLPPLPTPPRAG